MMQRLSDEDAAGCLGNAARRDARSSRKVRLASKSTSRARWPVSPRRDRDAASRIFQQLVTPTGRRSRTRRAILRGIRRAAARRGAARLCATMTITSPPRWGGGRKASATRSSMTCSPLRGARSTRPSDGSRRSARRRSGVAAAWRRWRGRPSQRLPCWPSWRPTRSRSARTPRPTRARHAPVFYAGPSRCARPIRSNHCALALAAADERPGQHSRTGAPRIAARRPDADRDPDRRGRCVAAGESRAIWMSPSRRTGRRCASTPPQGAPRHARRQPAPFLAQVGAGGAIRSSTDGTVAVDGRTDRRRDRPRRCRAGGRWAARGGLERDAVEIVSVPGGRTLRTLEPESSVRRHLRG